MNDAADVLKEGPWKGSSTRPPAPPPRFAVADLDGLALGAEPLWLVDRLLPLKGFGVVFGPPKNLKSFLIADALFHVAMGRPWAGCAVEPGAVVYITSEGVEGFKRRLIAMRQHYDVEGQGVPFGLVTAAPDFGHATDDHKAIGEQIRAYLASKGKPPLRAVVLDTVARSMKGADENTAKDMSTFVDNCGHVANAFDCLVLGVHHSGKDASRGSRGSNALDGAVDVMWSVEKGDPISTASIHHMKDGEDGLSWQFRVNPYTLADATPKRGPVTTCVVEIVGEPTREGGSSSSGQSATPTQRLALDALTEVLLSSGTELPASYQMPPGIKGVPMDAWREELFRRGVIERDHSNPRVALKRIRDGLKLAGSIGERDGLVWITR
jgi:hypothetical protein